MYDSERHHKLELPRNSTHSPHEKRQRRSDHACINRRPCYENRPRRSTPEHDKPRIQVEDYERPMSSDKKPMSASERFRRNTPMHNKTQVYLEHHPMLTDEQPMPASETMKFRRSASEEEDKALHPAQQHSAMNAMHTTKKEGDSARVKRSPTQADRDSHRAEGCEYGIDLESDDGRMAPRSKRNTPPDDTRDTDKHHPKGLDKTHVPS
ncbi:unnamed protein product [Hymenolepis diminuta]|uniref:Btz domain-containing protein n=1 Tax=Hymenolepis diminuta TaxID=6216 RepID=A0A0R3STD0_HYMDI|nr:unnamed protein product [Hymenolepis diminuta]VUZ51960.1 unnamed protein product [Hymenolepis diminuta]